MVSDKGNINKVNQSKNHRRLDFHLLKLNKHPFYFIL